ncbi:MAG: glycosyltransferase family 1 protein [Actinomycetota bacterium]
MTGPDAKNPLDVAVNLTWCLPGAVGGSEQYLARQLHGVTEGRAHPDLDLTVYAPRGYAEAHPDLAATVPIVPAPRGGRRRVARVVAEHTWLARRVRSAAVVHHGGGTMPSIGAGRSTVLTIHDLQYLTHPEYFSRVKLGYLRAVVPRSARRADIVTVPSAYVRSTVAERLGLGFERIRVVPHGLEPGLGVGAVDAATLDERFGPFGDGPLLVYPAVTHPHKGHRLLLAALARLVERSGFEDTRLVLIGGVGTAEDAMLRAVEHHSLGAHVIRTGRVTDAERDGLVQLADLLVFPSEYEGFGAPVIEAMALGTPVVSSDQPALVEVVSDAAVVAHRDPDAWVAAIEQAIGRSDELRRRGLDRAAAFTSAVSGAAIADAYRDAAVTGRGS